MANEMIERVAKAIAGGSKITHIHKLQAKAAIAAMREPTEEMIETKTKFGDSLHWNYNCHMCGGLKEGWYTMIDAALKED